MPDFDIVFRGGTVVDGTGAPKRHADVGVRGTMVCAIGDLRHASAAHDVSAVGRVVAPGFIDAHTHDDRYLTSSPDMSAKLSQGVTTVVTGNCGISLAPWIPSESAVVPPPLDIVGSVDDFRYHTFDEYLTAVDCARPAVNAACLVGHSTLRVATMDELNRTATATEIASMQKLLREALASGAIGMSSGVAYPPAMLASSEELQQVAIPLQEFGGVYTSHIRNDADQIFEALEEVIDVGQRIASPVVISHHKVTGLGNFGRAQETLKFLEQAMTRHPIGMDCYPYQAGSTMLRMSRVRDSTRVIVTRSEPYPHVAGQDLDVIAAQLGLSLEETVDALQPAGAIYFFMDENDVQTILAHPRTMIGSDGLPHDLAPHPRLWGTFPRVLGHYCRDLSLFSLEAAVHKMTGLTAQTFGLERRGVLAEGTFADIVMFDPTTVIDRATWTEPTLLSQGIETVVVNGTVAWDDGKHTGSRSGRVLRRQEL